MDDQPAVVARAHRPHVPVGALIVAVVVVSVAATVIVTRPVGTRDAEAAVIGELEDRAASGTTEIVDQRAWGQGRLVVGGWLDTSGARYLGLTFVIDRGRGWIVAGSTSDEVTSGDVGVGSLLVASSPGGAGQPAWSAAYGELSDDRVERVEVTWADDTMTSDDRSGDGYLIARTGVVDAREVRYLDAEGAEVARVPVPDSANT